MSEFNFQNSIWIVDGILFILVFLFGLGIVGLGLRKQILDARYKQAASKLKKDIQTLSYQGASSLKTGFPIFATRMTTGEFVEILKHRGSIIPQESEEDFRRLLVSSGKLKEVEDLAKTSRSKSTRVKAITCLGYTGSPSAVKILSEALNDRDGEVSYLALLALSRIKTKESAKALLNFLGKRTLSGQRIVSLLEDFPPDVTEEIILAAESPNATTRFWAVKLLCKFKPVQHWKKISRLTEDNSPNVRAAACECLGILENKETKPALIKRLQDKVAFVRMQAVRALFKIFSSESIPDLVHLMANDPSELVKESVKVAIISDIEKALPYIEECLLSNDEASKRYCIDALIDSNYIAEILADVLSDDSKNRKQAERILEGLVKSGVFFGLKRTLEEFVPSSQGKLMKAITQIDPVLARKILREPVEKL